MRPVKVAQQDEKDAVFSEGVKAGENVVTSGFGRLEDGAKVKLGDGQRPQASDLTAPATSLRTAPTTANRPKPGRQGRRVTGRRCRARKMALAQPA